VAIRNVIFDVGNVLVVWDPVAIESCTFGGETLAQESYVSPIRGNPIWLALNRGELTFVEARGRYLKQGFEAAAIDRFFDHVLGTQDLKHDTVAMMRDLADAGYRLFAITDNVREIVEHLKKTYDFWRHFECAAVSAEIGVLKPDPAIYRWLLEEAALEPDECVFMDDVPSNAEGAQAVGIEAFVFTTAREARGRLRAVGVAA
jgi:putative hydrolase of the HAD superfamily